MVEVPLVCPSNQREEVPKNDTTNGWPLALGPRQQVSLPGPLQWVIRMRHSTMPSDLFSTCFVGSVFVDVSPFEWRLEPTQVFNL